MSVIHLAFSRDWLVSSLSWDMMTRNRMYFIILVKAVFILIWCLLMSSNLPFLYNYLIAGVLFVICRAWALLKPTLNLQTEESLHRRASLSWGMHCPLFLFSNEENLLPPPKSPFSPLYYLTIRSELFKNFIILKKIGLYTMYRSTCIYLYIHTYISYVTHKWRMESFDGTSVIPFNHLRWPILIEKL